MYNIANFVSPNIWVYHEPRFSNFFSPTKVSSYLIPFESTVLSSCSLASAIPASFLFSALHSVLRKTSNKYILLELLYSYNKRVGFCLVFTFFSLRGTDTVGYQNAIPLLRWIFLPTFLFNCSCLVLFLFSSLALRDDEYWTLWVIRKMERFV